MKSQRGSGGGGSSENGSHFLLAFGPPIGPEQLDVEQVIILTISKSVIVSAHRRIAYCINFPWPPSECAATVYSSYPSRPSATTNAAWKKRRTETLAALLHKNVPKGVYQLACSFPAAGSRGPRNLSPIIPSWLSLFVLLLPPPFSLHLLPN